MELYIEKTPTFDLASTLNCGQVFRFREEGGDNDSIYEVRATIDDMTGEELGFVRDMAESAGAADVYYVPVYM